MKVDDIIVLENEERYTLLKDISYENEHYFLAVKIDEEENMDYKIMVILKLVVETDGEYVETVSDQKLLTILAKKFEEAGN